LRPTLRRFEIAAISQKLSGRFSSKLGADRDAIDNKSWKGRTVVAQSQHAQLRLFLRPAISSRGKSRPISNGETPKTAFALLRTSTDYMTVA
jgi:hypothetical protein